MELEVGSARRAGRCSRWSSAGSHSEPDAHLRVRKPGAVRVTPQRHVDRLAASQRLLPNREQAHCTSKLSQATTLRALGAESCLQRIVRGGCRPGVAVTNSTIRVDVIEVFAGSANALRLVPDWRSR